MFQHTAARRRLICLIACRFVMICFNTQPPEGGWCDHPNATKRFAVSTHSRPKAADTTNRHISAFCGVSTHSRPKAAGRQKSHRHPDRRFNTQPPEGGWAAAMVDLVFFLVSTHSRPKAAANPFEPKEITKAFQHTAARRRLLAARAARRQQGVSTHSRPKAAGLRQLSRLSLPGFQHTAARRRLIMSMDDVLQD